MYSLAYKLGQVKFSRCLNRGFIGLGGLRGFLETRPPKPISISEVFPELDGSACHFPLTVSIKGSINRLPANGPNGKQEILLMSVKRGEIWLGSVLSTLF